MEKPVGEESRDDFIKSARARSTNADIILLNKSQSQQYISNTPFCTDQYVTTIISLTGKMSCLINGEAYTIKSPGFAIISINSSLKFLETSNDFTVQVILFSVKFMVNLNIEERIPVFRSLLNRHAFEINKDQLRTLTDYFRMLQKTLTYTENPFYLKIAHHLTKAIFYDFGYNFHIKDYNDDNITGRKQAVVKNFVDLVNKNFKEQRDINFYANKLALTPKYLSKIVKEESGITSKEWIENMVITEIKRLLKSTELTVKEISYLLNFPSQTFLGKYFKRIVGLSPNDFRVT